MSETEPGPVPHRMVNGVPVPLTEAEIAARAAEEAARVDAPLRWEVPKLLVLTRLTQAGKLRAAITGLRREARAEDLTDAELALREMWDAAAVIYSDDAAAAAFFTAIGADPAEILARP
jgi:hypothetical protein